MQRMHEKLFSPWATCLSKPVKIHRKTLKINKTYFYCSLIMYLEFFRVTSSAMRTHRERELNSTFQILLKSFFFL